MNRVLYRVIGKSHIIFQIKLNELFTFLYNRNQHVQFINHFTLICAIRGWTTLVFLFLSIINLRLFEIPIYHNFLRTKIYSHSQVLIGKWTYIKITKYYITFVSILTNWFILTRYSEQTFLFFFIVYSGFSNRFIFLLCSPHLPWIVRICMRIAVHMLNSMRFLVMSLTRHRKQSFNGGRIKLFKFRGSLNVFQISFTQV